MGQMDEAEAPAADITNAFTEYLAVHGDTQVPATVAPYTWTSEGEVVVTPTQPLGSIIFDESDDFDEGFQDVFDQTFPPKGEGAY